MIYHVQSSIYSAILTYTELSQSIEINTSHTGTYRYIPLYTVIHWSVHSISRYIPVLGQVPETFSGTEARIEESSVYLVMYFLTNFILSYASVYRQLYDGHCPEYTCQLSKDTELPGVMLVDMSRCTVAMYLFAWFTSVSLES